MLTEGIPAIFDGKSFLLNKPINLKPATHVIIHIEAIEEKAEKKDSFLKTAGALNLDGPEDWSEKLDYYLYNHNLQKNGQTIS
jgi:hypothetical protein